MDHNHLLWDDTVAGPKPERIPGKNIMFQHLNNTNYGGSGSGSGRGFSTSSPSILSRSAPPPLTVLTVLDPVDVVVPVITRSITILKPNSSSNYYGSGGHDSSSLTSSSSVPSSPVDSSSSLSSSPFSPRTPQFDSKGLLLTRRKNPNPMTTTTTTTTKKKLIHEPRTPTVYDWVVISALDR